MSTNGAPPALPAPPAPLAPAYAGLATRTLAFGIDALIINCVAWFTGVLVALGLSLFVLPSAVKVALGVIGAVLAIIWSIAYLAFFWSADGQTPGDRVFRIRVVRAGTDEPLHPLRAVLRVFALVLSAIPLCAGFLMILFDDQRRALHDRLVGSVVVYAPVKTPPRRAPARAAIPMQEVHR